MTGLYKTPAERTFFNYYAVMPLADDRYASNHRALLVVGSLAITIITLGLYPLGLGLFMAGEYLLKGRVSQDLDNLADEIDRIQAAKLQAEKPIEKGESFALESLPLEIQKLIISKTGADQQSIKSVNPIFQQKTKVALIEEYKQNLSQLEKFLNKIDKQDLIQEIKNNKLNSESSVFKKTDLLTTVLVDKLTPDELVLFNKESDLSDDFKDLLYSNELLSEYLDRKTDYKRKSIIMTKLVSFLCEKRMFNKAKFAARNIPDVQIKQNTFLYILCNKSMGDNYKSLVAPILTKEFTSFNREKILSNLIRTLCSNNRIGTALRMVQEIPMLGPFTIIINELCSRGEFDLAKKATDQRVSDARVLVSHGARRGDPTKLQYDCYRIMFNKLCKNGEINKAIEFANSADNPDIRDRLFIILIGELARANYFTEAQKLVDQLAATKKEMGIYDEALCEMCSGYLKNNNLLEAKRVHDKMSDYSKLVLGNRIDRNLYKYVMDRVNDRAKDSVEFTIKNAQDAIELIKDQKLKKDALLKLCPRIGSGIIFYSKKADILNASALMKLLFLLDQPEIIYKVTISLLKDKETLKLPENILMNLSEIETDKDNTGRVAIARALCEKKYFIPAKRIVKFASNPKQGFPLYIKALCEAGLRLKAEAEIESFQGNNLKSSDGTTIKDIARYSIIRSLCKNRLFAEAEAYLSKVNDKDKARIVLVQALAEADESKKAIDK